MEIKSNRVTLIVAFVIGIGLTAMPSNAQQGTFNLPVQAHWGNAVLQPGEHTVKIPLPMGQTLVYLGGGGATQIAMPLTTESVDNPGRTYIRLSRINGEYYVDEYQSASGKKFFFHKPKANRGANSGAEESESTLVSVAGN